MNDFEKLMDEKLGRLHDKVDVISGVMEAIHVQVKSTNGRVTTLESQDPHKRLKLLELQTEFVRFMFRYPKLLIIIILFWSMMLISDIRHPLLNLIF